MHVKNIHHFQTLFTSLVDISISTVCNVQIAKIIITHRTNYSAGQCKYNLFNFLQNAHNTLTRKAQSGDVKKTVHVPDKYLQQMTHSSTRRIGFRIHFVSLNFDLYSASVMWYVIFDHVIKALDCIRFLFFVNSVPDLLLPLSLLCKAIVCYTGPWYKMTRINHVLFEDTHYQDHVCTSKQLKNVLYI